MSTAATKSRCLPANVIVEFRQGLLSPERFKASEQHLADCAECRRVLSELANVAPDPSIEDASRVLTNIAPKQDSGPRLSSLVPQAHGRLHPGHGTTLAGGDVVAERYRIRHFIARGGMGEVYAAEDIELHDELALKVLDPARTADEGQAQRLRREIQLARRITHPNVCRVFDLGIHRTKSRSVLFLTMELLQGETLSARIRREGSLRESQALPIIEQMVAGLAAAHAKGVIHRDLKSANVILAPPRESDVQLVSPSDGGGVIPRVVIIDFGLARGSAHRDYFAQMTRPGMAVGTPTYMAPEQLEGKCAEPTSDIYSLGVVLFEMVTGRLPFLGDPMEAAARRLREPPPRPRSIKPELSAQWEAVILRCLDRDPAARFQHVNEIVQALSPSSTSGRTPGREASVAAPVMRAPRRPWVGPRAWVLATTLGIAACLGVATFVIENQPQARPAMAKREAPMTPTILNWSKSTRFGTRRSVAVLDLWVRAQKEARAFTGVAVGELVRAGLAGGDRVRLVSGDEAGRAAKELSLGADDRSPAALRKLRQRLGVDELVFGSITPAGERLLVELAFEGEATGALRTISETTTLAGLPACALRLAERLREEVGLEALDEAAGRRARAALPHADEALRLYAEGILRHRRGADQDARALLQQAAALEPTHARTHFALSVMAEALGYRAQALAEARAAVKAATEQPPPDRLPIDARAAELGDHPREAVSLYRSRLRLLPDELIIGIALADAERAGNDPARALAVVTELHQLPPPAGADSAIDLAEARAALGASRWSQAVTAAQSAASKAAAVGAIARMSAARRLESTALLQLQEEKQALAAADRAIELALRSGLTAEILDGLLVKSVGLAQAGDLSAARVTLDQALTRAKQAGDLARAGRCLKNLAVLAERNDEPEAAARHWVGAANQAGASGDWPHQLDALEQAARVLDDAGKLSDSDRVLEQLLDSARKQNDLRAQVSALTARAELRLLQARLDDAEEIADKAEALLHDLPASGVELSLRRIRGAVRLYRGDVNGALDTLEDCTEPPPDAAPPSVRAACLRTLGEALVAHDKLSAARRAVVKAAALVKGGEPAPRAQLALASVSIESEEADESLALAASVFPRRDEAAHAQLLLARAHLVNKRPADAQSAVARALRTLDGDELIIARLQARVIQAEVAAALGDAPSAQATLSSAIEEARENQLLGLELEAQLLADAIDLQVGKPREALAHLLALGHRAGEAGFRAIARRAAAPRALVAPAAHELANK